MEGETPRTNHQHPVPRYLDVHSSFRLPSHCINDGVRSAEWEMALRESRFFSKVTGAWDELGTFLKCTTVDGYLIDDGNFRCLIITTWRWLWVARQER